MKHIKFKYKGQIKEADVYVDDLRRIKRNLFGGVVVHLFLIGDVELVEVDGVSVKKPWGLFHGLSDFSKLWNTENESRFSQPWQVRHELLEENELAFDKYLEFKKDRFYAYIEMIGQTDKYNNPEEFNDWYDSQLNSGKTNGEILDDLIFRRLSFNN